MQHFSATDLAELLPGTWRIAATNLPVWLDGDHLAPRIEVTATSADPLRLEERASFATAAGESEELLGRSRWSGTHFVRRGRGRRAFARSRWTVETHDSERDLLVVRRDPSLSTLGGIELVIRDGASGEGIRPYVASLTWLPVD
jgi:hypothetical protein